VETRPQATVVIISAISLALSSILFELVSFALLSATLVAVLMYARLRFISDIDSSRVAVERKVLESLPFARQPVPLTVEVLNTGSASIRGSFEDVLPEGCELSGGSNVFEGELLPKHSVTLSYSVTPPRRGTYTFPGLRMLREDAFGMYGDSQMMEKSFVLSVHTQKKALEAARRLAGKEHFEESGISRSVAMVMRDLEFDSIRDYASGDRARDIHWKLYSKMHKLMTKVYRKEGAIQTMILVDCSRSMRVARNGFSKLDHAVDLSLQLSRVLLSGFHSAGVALIDEVSVIGEIPPSLSRTQFPRIVRMLRMAPSCKELGPMPLNPATDERVPQGPEQEQFLAALKALGGASQGRYLSAGLDDLVRTSTTKSKGQKQLFIVISDLVSSRDSVVTGSKICQRTGNRMLVLHTYDDWYGGTDGPLDVTEAERLCENFQSQIGLEAQLRHTGASYLRIGPGDVVGGIVRAVRRGKA